MYTNIVCPYYLKQVEWKIAIILIGCSSNWTYVYFYEIFKGNLSDLKLIECWNIIGNFNNI